MRPSNCMARSEKGGGREEKRPFRRLQEGRNDGGVKKIERGSEYHRKVPWGKEKKKKKKHGSRSSREKGLLGVGNNPLLILLKRRKKKGERTWWIRPGEKETRGTVSRRRRGKNYEEKRKPLD